MYLEVSELRPCSCPCADLATRPYTSVTADFVSLRLGCCCSEDAGVEVLKEFLLLFHPQSGK